MGGWAGWGVAEAQNLVNTVVLRWRGAKNIGMYGVFLFREREKSRKHRLFDPFGGFAKTVGLTILGGVQKVPTTKITTTTTTGPSSNSYNNNNNDDDDDDNDDSYLVQMKSPSLSFRRPLQASRVCEALQLFIYIYIHTYNILYNHHRFKGVGRTQNVSYMFTVFLRGP